jgi:hypothetical protein
MKVATHEESPPQGESSAPPAWAGEPETSDEDSGRPAPGHDEGPQPIEEPGYGHGV